MTEVNNPGDANRHNRGGKAPEGLIGSGFGSLTEGDIAGLNHGGRRGNLNRVDWHQGGLPQLALLTREGQPSERPPATPKSLAEHLTAPVEGSFNRDGKQDIGGLDINDRQALIAAGKAGSEKTEAKLVSDINEQIRATGSNSVFSIKKLPHVTGHPELGVTNIYQLSNAEGETKDLFVANIVEKNGKVKNLLPDTQIAQILSEGNEKLTPEKLAVIEANLKGAYRQNATQAEDGTLALGSLYEQDLLKSINSKLQEAHPELKLVSKQISEHPPEYSYSLSRNGVENELIPRCNLDREGRDRDAQRLEKYAASFGSGAPNNDLKDNFASALKTAYSSYQGEGAAEVVERIRKAMQRTNADFELKGEIKSVKAPGAEAEAEPSAMATYYLYNRKTNKTVSLISDLNLSGGAEAG